MCNISCAIFRVQYSFSIYFVLYKHIHNCIIRIKDYINLYKVENGKVKLTSALPAGSREHEKILIGLDNNMESYWIPNLTNIQKIYHCEKLPGKCLYSSTNITTYKRHVKSCSDKTIVYSKRRSYGGGEDLLRLAIKHNILPEHFKDYRQPFFATYDCETLEHPNDCVAQGQQAVLKIASIALSSNLPGVGDECWIRKSSRPEHGKEIIHQFLDRIFELEQIYYDNLPDDIKIARTILDDMGDDKFSHTKTIMNQIETLIDKYHSFAVYSFNGG